MTKRSDRMDQVEETAQKLYKATGRPVTLFQEDYDLLMEQGRIVAGHVVSVPVSRGRPKFRSRLSGSRNEQIPIVP